MRTARRTFMYSSGGIALAMALSLPVHAQPVALPDTCGIWTRSEEVRTYAGNDLFLLVDGGADLFFEYGFRCALATAYDAHARGSIAVELYEMRSVHSAFGLFSSFARGSIEAADVGAEAVRGEGYLIFWKGVSVGMFSTSDTSLTASQSLTDIARRIAPPAQGGADVPALCQTLREAGFSGRSMVYVGGKLALSNTLPYAWVDALPASEGVAGEHTECHYVVLDYGDSAGAERALRSAGQGWERVRGLAVQDSAHGRTLRRSGEPSARLEVSGRFVIGVAGTEEAVRSELLALLRAAVGP